MGLQKIFQTEKLVMGVLISQDAFQLKLREILANSFGVIDFESGSMSFNYTRYYDSEMGSPIKRYFLSFQTLLPPDMLASVKVRSNRIEREFLQGGKRKVNLDPGLISLGKFILATTKDASHRIALQSGIFAEVTLVYERGSYRPMPWTYPDYRSEDYRSILKKIRGIYRTQRQDSILFGSSK